MGFVRAAIRGLLLRCPACSTGRMSSSWWSLFQLRERCASCGIPFIPGRGEFSGGVEVATYVSALVGLMGVLVMLANGGVPAWVLALWVASFGVLVPLLTYRNARGLWIGTMYGIQAWPIEGDAPHVAPITVSAWPWDE